jgi:hypothetical protein
LGVLNLALLQEWAEADGSMVCDGVFCSQTVCALRIGGDHGVMQARQVARSGRWRVGWLGASGDEFLSAL